MAVNIEIINNPYSQNFRVLIDGKKISIYSNLEKYMREPFYYWCDKILDSLYEECNYENFSLHFISRKEELKVMEKIAIDYPHCIQYSSALFENATPFIERMQQLNNIIKKVRTTGYHFYDKDVIFVLPDSLKKYEKDLSELEVKNSFCRINSKVTFINNLKSVGDNDIIFYIIYKNKSNLKFNIEKGFVIEIGDENCFKQKIAEVFFYETKEENLFETIFECLLLAPLLNIFKSCIDTLSAEIKEKYIEKIEELQSIEFKIIPVFEKTLIEVGRSSSIKFLTNYDGMKIDSSKLEFSYSKKGIIRCNGLLVEGLNVGNSTLYIYREGAKIPCASVDYTVIKRNRIEELIILEKCIDVGEGDTVKLDVQFTPVDADNIESIEWQSDNEKIAKIDNNGILLGVLSGSCNIRCCAEQVSTNCRCIVRPHLKDICTEFDSLQMIYGQEKKLNINLIPNEECIDGQITITSMDTQIINVVGDILKAIGIGQTRVVIENKEETVRKEISVNVITDSNGKSGKKKQKKWSIKKIMKYKNT